MAGFFSFLPLRITPKPYGSKSKTLWIQVQNLKDPSNLPRAKQKIYLFNKRYFFLPISSELHFARRNGVIFSKLRL